MTYLQNRVNDNLTDKFFGDFYLPFFRTSYQAARNNRTNLMKTDIKETDEGFDLGVELPGYKKDELNLELSKGYLNIGAEKSVENNETDKNGHFLHRERYCGSMKRSFYVGDDVTEEDIKAKFEDGVLKLHIPKKVKKEEIPEKKLIAIEG